MGFYTEEWALGLSLRWGLYQEERSLTEKWKWREKQGVVRERETEMQREAGSGEEEMASLLTPKDKNKSGF